MNLQLNGKVIIVSRGAQGIGRSILCELVREHAIPVIIDRSAPAGIALKKNLWMMEAMVFLSMTNLEMNE